MIFFTYLRTFKEKKSVRKKKKKNSLSIKGINLDLKLHYYIATGSI